MAEMDYTTTDENNTAHFERFQWHRPEVENALLPGRDAMHFSSNLRDISGGVRTILEIIEHDDLRNANGERQLLDANSRGGLLRIAIFSMYRAEESIDEFMEWAFDYHTPEGRAQRAKLSR